MKHFFTLCERILHKIALGAIFCGGMCLCMENGAIAENVPDEPPLCVQQPATSTTRSVEQPVRAPRRIGRRVASKPLTVSYVASEVKPSKLPPIANLPLNTTMGTVASEENTSKSMVTGSVAIDAIETHGTINDYDEIPEISPFVLASDESIENVTMDDALFLPEVAGDAHVERIVNPPQKNNMRNIADESAMDDLPQWNRPVPQYLPVDSTPLDVQSFTDTQNNTDAQNTKIAQNETVSQNPTDSRMTLGGNRLEETAIRAGNAEPEQDIATLLHALQNSSEPLRFGNDETETITGTTTIERLAQIADAQNPTMEQASRTLDQARGNHLQVGLYPNPVVGYTAGELGDEGSAGKQGGFVQQRIVTAGKLSLNRQVAESEVSQAFYVVEQQRLRVQNDVRVQAMEVLALQQQIALDQKLLEISQDGLQAAEQLFKSQEVSRADMLQARVEKNSAQLQLDTVRAKYLGAWRKLTAMIGEPELPPTKITDALQADLQPIQWDSILAKLLEESPELAEAKAGVQRAQNNLARQNVEPIPDIEAMGGVLYNDVNGYTIGTAQLGVSVPLFDRNQGNIASAQAEIVAARANVRRVELALQDRLAGAFREYEAARRQCYRYSTEILPDAQETLRITMLGYHQGEFTYLQLLTAQRSCFQATRNYIESLQNLRTNAIRIHGLMLSGGLNF